MDSCGGRIDPKPARLEVGASGWSTLARTVREVDDAKIRDCKEDIDTLLVFAGLFSAIMTAFVVESYKGLQQDPATLTVEILQEIAAQTRSYSVKEGSLNSTAAQTRTTVPFKPPSSVVHLNALWFASLTFSLITASIAILVKQWLREYLGGEYIGPRARLRVRHFRFPGLATWKVFEIVALLPLFLQLSLGLFLIGLCLFTTSIHPAVGFTCVPLVAGWAFFFVATIIAPVISPRCPYKAPLIKDLTRLLRPTCYKASYVLGQYVTSLIHRMRVFGSRTGSSRTRTTDVRVPSHSGIQSYYPHPEEEESCAEDDDRDMEILVALDTFFTDDDIFLTAIWKSFWEMQPDDENTSDFITLVLKKRLGVHRDIALLPPLDLRSLTPRVHETLLEATINLLKIEFCKEDSAWRSWTGNALSLLLSISNSNHWHKIADVVYEVYRMYLERHRESVCYAIARSSCFREDGPTDIFLERFGRVLARYEKDGASFAILEEIVGRVVHRDNYGKLFFNLSNVFDHGWPSALTTSHVSSLAGIAVELLQQALEQTENPKGHWQQWMADASVFVLSSVVASDSGATDRFPAYFSQNKIGFGIVALLAHERSSATLWRYMLRPGFEHITKGRTLGTLHTVYLDDAVMPLVLRNFQNFINGYLTSSPNVDIIPLTHLAVRMIRLPHAMSWICEWRSILSSLATAMEGRGTHWSIPAHGELAETVMLLTHALECNNFHFHPRAFKIPEPVELLDPESVGYFLLDDEAAYRQWRNSFDSEQSLFPDDFIFVLSTIARKETRWYRVRRLKEMGYYVMSP